MRMYKTKKLLFLLFIISVLTDNNPLQSQPNVYDFIYLRFVEGNYDIYLTDQKSNNVFVAQSNSAWVRVSPSHNQVVYTVDSVSKHYSNLIQIIDLDTGKITSVVAGAQQFSPVWSPNGASIAFLAGENDSFDIFLYSIENDEISRVSIEETIFDSLEWQPNGDIIANVCNEELHCILKRYDISNPPNSGDVLLESVDQSIMEFSISDDGSTTAFIAYDEQIEMADVHAMRLGSVIKISNVSADYRNLRWLSTDTIGYASDVDGDWDIYATDISSLSVVNLSQNDYLQDGLYGFSGYNCSGDLLMSSGPFEGSYNIIRLSENATTIIKDDFVNTNPLWLVEDC